VSVPPVQPHSMGLGYAVMPNLTGIVEALHHVAPPSALDKADPSPNPNPDPDPNP